MSADLGPRRRIAVVGGGIAGMTSALLLQDGHDVTLFEKEGSLGGHAHAVEVQDSPSTTLAVDTAFLVFNDGTYPLFMKLLRRLGVLDAVQQTEMSTSYHDARRGFMYALGKGIRRVFAQPRNLGRPTFARLLWDIARFRRTRPDALAAWSQSGLTLRELLAKEGYSRSFVTDFVCPMGGAIWSLPAAAMLDFPAAIFMSFFANHRMLRDARSEPARWLTFRGSSRRYVDAFASAFAAQRGAVRRGKVAAIQREDDRVRVGLADGSFDWFDDVVLATHANDALALLERPTDAERRLLGTWRYSPSCATLHTDATCMPPRRDLWSCWNTAYDASDLRRGSRVTYHLNTVQRVRARQDYFLSLGDEIPIDPSRVLERFVHQHPVYSLASIASQAELPTLNGAGNTYFCGSYFGFGFHEDAVRSAVDVAHRFGLRLEDT